MDNYTEERRNYLEDPDKFWIEKFQTLTWFNKWEQLHNYEPGKHNHQWFVGGKINLSYEFLDKRVKEGHGDEVALIVDSPFTKTVTHHTISDILDKVSRMAGVLSDCGVKEGDHVSIYLPNIVESVVSMLATVRLGAVYSVLNTMKPETAMSIRFDDFKPKVIVTTNCDFISKEEVFNPKQYTDRVLHQCEHKPEKIIVLQRKYAEPAKLFAPRDLDWDEAMTTATPHDCVPIEINRPLFVIYTSGTTGKPKGVIISSLYVVSNCVSLARALIGSPPKQGEHKIMYTSSYYIWIGGQLGSLYMPMHQRIPFILWEQSLYGAHIEETLKLLTDYKVTSMFMAASTIRGLIKEDPNGEISALYKPMLNFEHIYIGGAPGDPTTFSWIEDHLTPNTGQLYGLTESGLLTTVDISNGRTFSDHPRMAAGNVLPGMTVKILRSDGTEADVNEIGRVAIKLPMPSVSSGFLGDVNKQKFIKDYLTSFPGYFDSNDEGYYDSKRNLYVLNRADSVFKIAGNRMSCDALEEVIMSHPDVGECSVVTRILTNLSELPVVLFVTNKRAHRPSKEIAHELEALVVNEFGNWVTFDELIHVEEIPKNQNGKIARGTVQEMVRNGQIKPSPADSARGHTK